LNATSNVTNLTPCLFLPLGDISPSVTVLLKPKSVSEFSVNCLTIYIMQTAPFQDYNGFEDDLPFCPERRFFQVQVDSALYNAEGSLMPFASNLTIRINNTEQTQPFVYNRIGLLELKYEQCDSQSYIATNDTYGAAVNGFLVPNLIQQGRWWIVVGCRTPNLTYDPLTAGYFWAYHVTPTCSIDCFKHGGVCSMAAPLPFCHCGFWFADGQFNDCTQFFPGDWVLIAVGCLLVLFVVLFVVFKVRSHLKEDHQKRQRLLAYQYQDSKEADHLLNNPVNS